MPDPLKVLEINGAKVALYQIGGLKAVSLDIRLKAGSWYEEGNSWGKSHLLEHMMFQGSKKFVSKTEMEIFKEEHGIWNNAYTHGAQVELRMRMPAESIKQGFELASEMLYNMTIPEENLVKEKKVIAQEYQDKQSRPTSRFAEKIREQMFGKGHLYTRDGMGTPDCFEKATSQEILDYQKKFFVPANMSVSVAGKFDLQLIELELQKLLSVSGTKSEIEFSPVNPSSEKLIHIESDMKSAELDLTWLTSGSDVLSYSDRVTAGIGSYLIGGGTRSILYKIVRDQLGLAYGISAGFGFYTSDGWLSIGTSVKPENIDQVITIVKESLDKFINNPIDSELFQRTKKYLQMQDEMSYESAMGTATSLSSSLFWEDKVITSEDYKNLLKNITEDQVRDSIRKVVENKNPLIAIMKSK